MKKLVMALVALAAVVAVATPALAEIKVNGYYRLQGIATNSQGTSTNFDGPTLIEPPTQSLIDQRLRMKVTNTLNENVSIVWFGEVDGTFGTAADNGPGGDAVRVETKNAYLDFKVPNSIFSVRTGLQGIGNRYQGLIVADDWSAIKVGMDLSDAAKLTLLYSKPYEGFQEQWDDVDFYNASLDLKVADLKLGADVAWFNNNVGTAGAPVGAGDSLLFSTGKPVDIYLLAAKADAKIGDIGIDGFVIYAMGSESNMTGDLSPEMDFASYAATVRVSAKVADIGLSGRVIYMSGDDDATDDEWNAFIPNLGGNYDFAGENLMIFTTDAYYNNGPGGRMAIQAATDGAGLLGLTAQANADFGAVYLKTGLGYFMANETAAGQDDQMGFEVAARVGTKIAGNVDLSLGGAYAMLGDFWAIGNETPDDIYKVAMMVNVGF